MYKRKIEEDIDKYLHSDRKKILFDWGPRRSGKTTVIDKLAAKLKVTKYNFDLHSDREKFAPRREILEAIVKENTVILIDEVQNYPEATVMLKILHDEFKVKIIATGSSELRQKSTKEFDTLAADLMKSIVYLFQSLKFEKMKNQKILSWKYLVAKGQINYKFMEPILKFIQRSI